jgi:hypothetical protein
LAPIAGDIFTTVGTSGVEGGAGVVAEVVGAEGEAVFVGAALGPPLGVADGAGVLMPPSGSAPPQAARAGRPAEVARIISKQACERFMGSVLLWDDGRNISPSQGK